MRMERIRWQWGLSAVVAVALVAAVPALAGSGCCPSKAAKAAEGVSADASAASCPATKAACAKDKAKCDKKSCDKPCSKKDAKSDEATSAEATDSQPRPTITGSALKALLDAKVPVVVADARSGKYDDGRRIPTAISLNAGSSEEEITKVIPNKDTLVVTYCANPKCPASSKLASHLTSLGYKNVIELPEGIDGWVAAGYTVEKPERHTSAQPY